jgi:hypothetical protein
MLNSGSSLLLYNGSFLLLSNGRKSQGHNVRRRNIITIIIVHPIQIKTKVEHQADKNGASNNE